MLQGVVFCNTNIFSSNITLLSVHDIIIFRVFYTNNNDNNNNGVRCPHQEKDGHGRHLSVPPPSFVREKRVCGARAIKTRTGFSVRCGQPSPLFVRCYERRPGRRGTVVVGDGGKKKKKINK